MTDALVLQSCEASPASSTVADIMRAPLTTIEHSAHVAAAAYVMKHAGASALMIRDGLTDQPIGIITEADIAHAVAVDLATAVMTIKHVPDTPCSARTPRRPTRRPSNASSLMSPQMRCGTHRNRTPPLLAAERRGG